MVDPNQQISLERPPVPRPPNNAQSILPLDRLFSGAAHPGVCFIHVLFKSLALICYIFLGIFVPDSIVFILAIVLSAVDFWVVQNITGRMLVGLKWKNQILEDGSEEWIYNSYETEINLNKMDKHTFWIGLFAAPGAWGVFMAANLLTMNAFWMLCDAINFGLGYVNLRGYWKCNKDYQEKLKTYFKSQSANVALSVVLGSTSENK